MTSETVAVLGASDKPERYSNKAIKMLIEHHHRVIPINPRLATIEGVPVVRALAEISGPVDTLTLYVGPEISSKLGAEIAALHPKRVIFNPGTENPELEATLSSQGIIAERACTLVLLSTGQF